MKLWHGRVDKIAVLKYKVAGFAFRASTPFEKKEPPPPLINSSSKVKKIYRSLPYNTGRGLMALLLKPPV